MKTSSFLRPSLKILHTATIGVCVCFCGVVVWAEAILDQSNIPHSPGLEVTISQSDAQTFTVGIGGRLTRVDLVVNHHRGVATDDLVVDLASTAGGIPISTVLARVVLPPSAIPLVSGTVTVDLSQFVLPVVPGQVLAIVLSSEAPNASGATYAWAGDSPGTYGGGDAFISILGSPWGSWAGGDMGFQTFVVVDADSDGDGVIDSADKCPNSELSPTVIIGGCDSGVANTLSPDGCSISDLISECATATTTRHEFFKCVVEVTKNLKEAGVINGSERAKIQKCAANAHGR